MGNVCFVCMQLASATASVLWFLVCIIVLVCSGGWAGEWTLPRFGMFMMCSCHLVFMVYVGLSQRLGVLDVYFSKACQAGWNGLYHSPAGSAGDMAGQRRKCTATALGISSEQRISMLVLFLIFSLW